MDSGFHRIDLGDVQVLDFWFQSLSWFPDSKANDSQFHKQSRISRIRESGLLYMGRET